MFFLRVCLTLVFGLRLCTAAFAGEPAWTVLVYGNGDNNLSPQLVTDLMKMEEVGSSPTFRIVAEADFDASNADENEEAGLPAGLNAGTSRFLIAKSADDERLTSKPVMRLRELNHDDPKVLKNFLVWAMRKYPADRYGLIFWDHGGQWEGYGGDEQDGELDEPECMGTAQIREALSRTLRETGTAKFDFVAFDTCLMGGMEVLEDFAGLTEVFIACPEIDYGDGWNYADSFAWLKNHPAATMREFAVAEVDQWKAIHMTEDNECDRVLAAHCAYDMARYPETRNAFAEFTTVLARTISPHNLSVPSHRREAVEYSLSLEDDVNASDFIDLGQFARSFAEDPASSAALRRTAARLAEAIDAMVLAKALGEEKAGASGLSVWYPVKREGDDEEDDDADADDNDSPPPKDKFLEYKSLNIFKNSAWADYIKKVWLCREELEDEPVLADNKPAPLRVAASGGLSLNVDVASGKGAFLLHGALIDPAKKKGKYDVVFLGQVVRKRISGPGSYQVPWDLKALSLTNADGSKALLGAFPKDSAGRLWFSYAQYKRSQKAKPFKVILLIQVKDGAAKLLKMLDAENGDLAPAPIQPRPGASLSPLYIMETRKGKNPDKWREGLFPSGFKAIVPKEGLAGMKTEMAPVGAGDYTLELQAEDINGNLSDIVTYHVNVAP